ncbi:MAG: alpha amylase C-terminal domain-containing protein, partial [Vulcanimicrobiota bacterium]
DMAREKPVAKYAPTTYSSMGATRDEDNVNFKFWSPHAQDIKVRVWDEDPDNAEYVQLKKDPETNMWSGGVEDGWKKFEGKTYCYEITTSEGKKVYKNDPYARYLQGQQRGITTMYLHPTKGFQVHQYYKDSELAGQGKPSFKKFVRFEVQGHDDANKVYLKLTDEQGKPMKKEDLLSRLGETDPDLVSKYHKGGLNDHWLKNIDNQGRIKLVKQGKAWASIMDSPDKIPGMHYKFEIHKADASGKDYIVGDANRDGNLSADEAKKTHFNDPYSGKIHENFGWQRFGIIKEPSFNWQNDNVPRMAPTKDKMVIYQMHVGSVFGDSKNVQRSTFKDVLKKLDYFKDLGVNTLEVLPANTFEGSRDWGYIGTSSFAMSDQYGFVDDNGEWVSGTDAVKKFVDAAHGKGFNVINDVVYNHWGGDYNNMWDLDGMKNPYFDWDHNPKVTPQKMADARKNPRDLEPGHIFKSAQRTRAVPGTGESDLRGRIKDARPEAYRDEDRLIKNSQEMPLFKKVRHTDWGAMPAFNKEAVSQFAVDNAVAQLDEFHFDGLRFDFTHPIHAQGWGGGTEGWNLLRKINRQVHFFHPQATTAAEEFPNTEPITKPAQPNGKGGAGFDHMWNTEFQHRLVHDHSNPAILQQATKGWKTDMDKFMNHMVFHPGFTNKLNSVTVISNHDEVGNAARTVNVATNHDHHNIPDKWARGASRFAFGVGMLSPGVPMFFQGEESMARNFFSWGRPDTWDVGWDWMDIGKDWNWNKTDLDTSSLEKYDKLAQMNNNHRSESPDYRNLSEDNKKVVELLASAQPEERQKLMEGITRKLHHRFCKDITNLRTSNQAFDGDAGVTKLYTHNDNSVMAFSRHKNGEEFLVVGSLNKNKLANYNIPLQSGKYELVFNSDSKYYGGDNFGSKIHIDGHADTRIDIPAGGLLVYKRVG